MEDCGAATQLLLLPRPGRAIDTIGLMTPAVLARAARKDSWTRLRSPTRPHRHACYLVTQALVKVAHHARRVSPGPPGDFGRVVGTFCNRSRAHRGHWPPCVLQRLRRWSISALRPDHAWQTSEQPTYRQAPRWRLVLPAGPSRRLVVMQARDSSTTQRLRILLAMIRAIGMIRRSAGSL